MFCPTMARRFWSSLAGLLLLGAMGCRPAAPDGPQPVLVYCTLSGELQARVLKRILEERGGRTVVLAPLTGQDMLAAIEGTKAGDFAVFPEPPVLAELTARGLLRGEPLRLDLRFLAIAKGPFTLADLATPGKRLGGLRAASPLDQALRQAIPASLWPQIESNIRQRSDRAGELEQLVRLGALDAAFVWASPLAADLVVVPVGGDMACCPLLIAPLSCSRLGEAQARDILQIWRDPDVVRALHGRPAVREARAP